MYKRSETIIQKADKEYAIAKHYENTGHPRKAQEYKDKAALLYNQSGKYGHPKIASKEVMSSITKRIMAGASNAKKEVTDTIKFFKGEGKNIRKGFGKAEWKREYQELKNFPRDIVNDVKGMRKHALSSELLWRAAGKASGKVEKLMERFNNVSHHASILPVIEKPGIKRYSKIKRTAKIHEDTVKQLGKEEKRRDKFLNAYVNKSHQEGMRKQALTNALVARAMKNLPNRFMASMDDLTNFRKAYPHIKLDESMVKKAKKKKGVDPLIAGLAGGAVSATAVAPIDLLKTQIKAGKVPSNVFKATKTVYDTNISDIKKTDLKMMKNLSKFNKPKQMFSKTIINIPKPIRAIGKFWKGNPATMLKLAPAVGVQLAVFKALSNK